MLLDSPCATRDVVRGPGSGPPADRCCEGRSDARDSLRDEAQVHGQVDGVEALRLHAVVVERQRLQLALAREQLERAEEELQQGTA